MIQNFQDEVCFVLDTMKGNWFLNFDLVFSFILQKWIFLVFMWQTNAKRPKRKDTWVFFFLKLSFYWLFSIYKRHAEPQNLHNNKESRSYKDGSNFQIYFPIFKPAYIISKTTSLIVFNKSNPFTRRSVTIIYWLIN